MSFDREQWSIVGQSALAVLVAAAALCAGYLWLPPDVVGVAHALNLADRLAFALKWNLPIFLWLAGCVAAVSQGRFCDSGRPKGLSIWPARAEDRRSRRRAAELARADGAGRRSAADPRCCPAGPSARSDSRPGRPLSCRPAGFRYRLHGEPDRPSLRNGTNRRALRLRLRTRNGYHSGGELVDRFDAAAGEKARSSLRAGEPRQHRRGVCR